jgi:thiol-disulfide isomerase/thioredoxin
VILACRLVLAAVLAIAAVAKLADREGTRRAVVAFGAPESLAAPLALLLPAAELAVAVLLLPTATALAGAVGALALLALFSAAIAVNLVRGREPDCHCFGQLHSAPAGPRTLLRNAGLAGLAALTLAGTLAGSDTSAVAWVGRLDGAEAAMLVSAITAAALLTVGAIAFLSLLRAHGRVLVRLEQVERALSGSGPDRPAAVEPGLRPGTPAPAFTVADSAGGEVSLGDLLAPGVPLMLVFASPHCVPCRALLPEVAAWQSEHAQRLTVAIASDGTADDVRSEADELGLDRVLVDDDRVLYRAFRATGTPSAVLIAPDRSIMSRIATGPGRIDALLASVVDVPGLPIGAPVPVLELPSVYGDRVNLAGLEGRDTLLMFWNPDCGHCRAMHDDLLAWESGDDALRPRLVIVSSGGEAKTRSEGFRARMLLDEHFAAAERFGIRGTPMALMLGADGRIASEVAAGAEAVFALLSRASLTHVDL